MSSSEELFQYEDKSDNSFKSASHKAGDVDNNCSVIPQDMYGLYGVHVSNLPHDISEEALNRTFSVVGKVAVCKLMEPRSRRGGQMESHSIAYAFVKFASSKEAHNALSQFNGYTLNGSTLAVRPAYMSERIRRRPAPNVKHDGDKSSEKANKKSNENKKGETQRVTYVMSSADCRLKDGRLHNSDVMLFSGTSVKTSPPKKAYDSRVLAPRFRKDSSPKSFESKGSHDSHSFQGAPSHITSRSEVPRSQTVSRQNKTVHQNAVSDYQTSDNFHNNTDASISAGSSAFRPYQETSNQLGGIQKPVIMENDMTNVASSLSHLVLSSPSHSVVENKKNAPNWNHSHGNDDHSWRRDGGSSSSSPPGGMTVMSWSNGRDKPIVSPDRTKSMEQWNPQPRPSVSSWSTADVVQYFYNSDCAEYAGFFREQEIDGRALMLLNRDTLLHFMKVGPALKVLQLIDELRAYGPPSVTHSGN